MTAPVGGLAEAEKAAIALQVALTRLGIKTIAAALALWRQVPANKAAEVADEWLDKAVLLVMGRREMSRDLAVAYYRLARALRTGTTIPDPRNPIPTTVTLAELRAEFTRAVEAVEDVPETPTPIQDSPDEPEGTEGASEPDVREPVVVIPIEDIDGIDEDGDEEDALIEEAAEEEARIVLAALGTTSLKKRVDEIDHDEPAKVVDLKRDEAHAKAGSRQAAAADRLVKNGGRAKLSSLAERDERVLGFVRVSQTGTPCGWCAMLISRGLVLYRSKESAEFRQDGQKYHDNCNCVAIEVYSEEQFNSEDIFDLNREYGRLWPIVTKGLSGKAAVSAWRRYIRQQQKANPGGVATDNDNAQEAA